MCYSLPSHPAFIGFNTDGTVVNQWDAPDKNFTLTKTAVTALQAAGKVVLVSMGGADGGVWPDSAPPTFISNMATGIVGVINDLGLDGIDFDIERCDVPVPAGGRDTGTAGTVGPAGNPGPSCAPTRTTRPALQSLGGPRQVWPAALSCDLRNRVIQTGSVHNVCASDD